jgi:hypothetical protein
VKCSVRFAALIFGLSVALSASAQIYQWKDKDGKTHFSDMPPPSQSGVQMQKASRPAPPPAAIIEPEPDAAEGESVENGETDAEPKNAAAPAQEKKSQADLREEEFRKRRAAAAEAREKAEKDAARKAQQEQGCQRARSQLAALKSGQRIALPTESGGRKVLDDEERAAEMARAEEQIKALCDGK